MQRAIFARELDRAFVGFATRIGKEHLVEAALLDQRVGELQAGIVVIGRARGDQKLGLRGQRVGHDIRRVAEAIHRPALDEIEIALAGVVPQPGAFAAGEDDARARGDVHQRVEGTGGVGHVELLWRWMKGRRKRKKAALFGVRPSRELG